MSILPLAGTAPAIPSQRTGDPVAFGCPAWCTTVHTRADQLDAAGFDMGYLHEHSLAELVGIDPAYINDPATASVWVEAFTGGGTADEASRVVLTVAEGDAGAYPSEEGCRGWSGTPEQAARLAAALLAAARTVHVDRAARPHTIAGGAR